MISYLYLVSVYLVESKIENEDLGHIFRAVGPSPSHIYDGVFLALKREGNDSIMLIFRTTVVNFNSWTMNHGDPELSLLGPFSGSSFSTKQVVSMQK